MEKQFKEIIEKNLPKQVGDTLRKRLELCDDLEKKVVDLADEIEAMSDEIDKKSNEIREMNAVILKDNDLDAKEKRLNKVESELEIDKLSYQLESEKDKTIFAKEVALGLVRNTEYRRSVFDNISEPTLDQYGNQVNTNKSQDSTETKKAE